MNLNADQNLNATHLSAIDEAIGLVGTGKKGSEDLPVELASRLAQDILAGRVGYVKLGAFLGALAIKGLGASEIGLESAFPQGLLHDFSRVPSWLITLGGVENQNATESPRLTEVHSLAASMASGARLTRTQAETMGDFLFADTTELDPLRAFVTTILRVRYTEPEEYSGLLSAILKTVPQRYFVPLGDPGKASTTRPICQIAEPFDGVDKCLLLTPLLAQIFAEQGWDVILMAGRSAGPKYGFNLRDLCMGLDIPKLESFSQLLGGRPGGLGPLGPGRVFWVDQKDLSPALDRWVDLRKQILKRPFLATLEKFVNPWGAKLFVGSAFHHNFTDKMSEIASLAGFESAIVTFKGLEGSLTPSLKRGIQVLRGWRKPPDSEWQETIQEFRPENFGLQTSADLDWSLESDALKLATLKKVMAEPASLASSLLPQVQYSRLIFHRELKDLHPSIENFENGVQNAISK